MCFCFDGESAVAAYRPDECRERLPAARVFASPPIASGGGSADRALPARRSPAAPNKKSVALTA